MLLLKIKKANKGRYLIQCSGCVSGITFINCIFDCSNTLYILLSNLSTLSVPDEGYSRKASCALNLISTFLLWYLHAREFKLIHIHFHLYPCHFLLSFY